ncbi:MAG: hypothetical protein WCK67_03215 [bacterium]
MFSAISKNTSRSILTMTLYPLGNFASVTFIKRKTGHIKLGTISVTLLSMPFWNKYLLRLFSFR